MVDFSRTNLIKKFDINQDEKKDYAPVICDYLLNEFGLALVPSSDFGHSNAARMSLVLEETSFKEAVVKLILAINSN